MGSESTYASSGRALALLTAALDRPRSPIVATPPRWLAVDVERQRLVLMEGPRVAAEYVVSTAAAGVGGAEGSLRTPPGWHRIERRIGAEAPLGAVFESREPTGRVWRDEPVEEDLILTRILTLAGLEDGVNRGPGVDSLERYIYVHGTNHERELGRPVSHGCIRMANHDIVELFERIAEGDPLVIVDRVPDAVA